MWDSITGFITGKTVGHAYAVKTPEKKPKKEVDIIAETSKWKPKSVHTKPSSYIESGSDHLYDMAIRSKKDLSMQFEKSYKEIDLMRKSK